MEVVFEDDHIVVVNKPAGVYVHAAPGHEKGSLADELARTRPYMRTVGSEQRPGVVHRLDAETSGVMVFAKTQAAYLKLRELFEQHVKVKKTYLAVLHGAPSKNKGIIDLPIGKKPWDAKRMAVNVPEAKPAVTHWEVLAKRSSLALVEFVIETGRTHQIRVHSAYLGHPIVGDKLYGDSKRDQRLPRPPKRQLLHAVSLAFPHPITSKKLEFSVPPPNDIIFAIP